MANNPCGGVPQPHAFEHAFKGATLFECTPYAGLMMLPASQDFRRDRPGTGTQCPDGRGARAHV